MAFNVKDFVQGIQDRLMKPTSYIASGEKTDFYDISTTDLKRVPFEDLEKLYLSDPMVFSGINLFSQACLGRGFYVESDNERAKTLCEKALNLVSFKPTLLGAIANTLLYGVGFQEIIWSEDEKDILGYKLIDPKTIKIKWDQAGTITEFGQMIKGSLKATFKPSQIIFYKFFQIADGMEGIGFVEPIKDDLEIKQDVENSIREMVKKFAYPALHVIKKGAKRRSELDEIKKDFKEFDRKTFFATNESFEIKPLDFAKRIPDLSFYINLIIDSIACGLRVPVPFLLERGEKITRATAYALMEYSNFEISLIQEKLTSIIETQNFTPLCLRNNLPIADLKWHPLTSEDEAARAKVIREKIVAVSTAVREGLLDRDEGRGMLVSFLKEGDKAALGVRRGKD